MDAMLPRCSVCGARSPLLRIPKDIQEGMWGGWTCEQCGTKLNWRGQPRTAQDPDASVTTITAVHLEPRTTRVEAMFEDVAVPQGASITVRRSRTIEHTLQVELGQSVGGELNLGLTESLKAQIQGAIERKQGQIYQHTETVEYTVQLDGKESKRYRLVWSDIWQGGTAEIVQDGISSRAPFQLRVGTELDVKAAP